MTSTFIKGAIKKKGALSRQLGIPVSKNIPMKLLNKIVASRPGQRIKNPTEQGKPYITVTRKLERRANLARNLKRLNR